MRENHPTLLLGVILLFLFIGLTSTVNATSVYDVLWLRLDRFWLSLDYLTETIVQNLTYYRDQATSAWQDFFSDETPVPVTATLDAPTLETIKAEIKAELFRELGSSASVVNKQNSSTAGLVILPASGNPTLDEATKLELKNAFSDQVEVHFDPSGQTGIITPILRQGDNYLFVLTPLKR